MTRRALFVTLAISWPIVILVAVVAVGRARGAHAPAGTGVIPVEGEGAVEEEAPPPRQPPRRRLDAVAIGAASRAPAAAHGAGTSPRVPAGELQAQMQAVAEERVAKLTSLAQVDGFLAELEGRARTRGAVTAADVQPGLMALRMLEGQFPNEDLLKRQMTFSREMVALGRELSAPAPAAIHQPTTAPENQGEEPR